MIREAFGNEITLLGHFDGNAIDKIQVLARGKKDSTLVSYDALLYGDVLIHNHPDGNLTPSEADLRVAGSLAEKGVSSLILDNQVENIYPIIPPERFSPPKHIKEEEILPFFDQGGYFSRIIPLYKPRSGQIDMALSWAASLNDGSPLFVEAGTGTGKTLAYLVPSILYARKNHFRFLVSTTTKTLQDQLLHKDVAILSEAFCLRGDPPVKAASIKGRTNYVCKRRFFEQKKDVDLFEEKSLWQEIADILKGGGSGERAALPPMPGTFWEKIESTSPTCLRQRCAFFKTCSYYTALRKGHETDFLLVNHSLFFLDLLGSKNDKEGFLPGYQFAILDEAHGLSERGRGLLEKSFTRTSLSRILTNLDGKSGKKGKVKRSLLTKLEDSLKSAPNEKRMQATKHLKSLKKEIKNNMPIEDFFSEVQVLLDKGVSALPGNDKQWQECVLRLSDYLESLLFPLASLLSGLGLSGSSVHFVLEGRRVLEKLEEALSFVQGLLEKSSLVYWIAQSKRGPSLHVCPVLIGRVLADFYKHRRIHALLFTSATLTVNKNFQFFAEGSGTTSFLENGISKIVESPFQYKKQVRFVCPRSAPIPPASPHTSFIKDQLHLIKKHIVPGEGGTLILTTSKKHMELLTEAMTEEGYHPSFQNPDNPHKGIEDLRKGRIPVLIGMDSYWQGVDLPGESLKTLIMTRFPFRYVQGNPLYEEMRTVYEEEGKDFFFEYLLPEAIMKFKQGFGRLIRTEEDKGLFLLLDPRLYKKSYGKMFLNNLPEGVVPEND